jgi:hypothetical protein
MAITTAMLAPSVNFSWVVHTCTPLNTSMPGITIPLPAAILTLRVDVLVKAKAT